MPLFDRTLLIFLFRFPTKEFINFVDLLIKKSAPRAKIKKSYQVDMQFLFSDEELTTKFIESLPIIKFDIQEITWVKNKFIESFFWSFITNKTEGKQTLNNVGKTIRDNLKEKTEKIKVALIHTHDANISKKNQGKKN